MKLYSLGLSPFAARVRISIYAKGLDVEIVPPPEGGMKSPEYLGLNPMGRVPVLITDEGHPIPESETIVEYLEDRFPSPSLRPASPEDKARARLIARVDEIYVGQPMITLFGQFDPAKRDAAVVDQALLKLDEGLSYVERFMGPGPYALGDKLTTADCQLTPNLFFVGVLGQTFGRGDLLEPHDRLAAYGRMMREEPVLGRVLGEMAEGLKAFRRG